MPLTTAHDDATARAAGEPQVDATAAPAPTAAPWMQLFGPYVVQSSVVSTVAYYPYAALLDVRLKNGACYRYFDVPMPTCAAFLAAASKGRFFNAQIKDRFRFRRV
jgi:hypothetical protein